MYVTKESKSPFYHLIYFDENGARKKVSTKQKIKREAEKYMKNFSPCDNSISVHQDIVPVIIEKVSIDKITLDAFRIEFEEFIRQTKSKHHYNAVKLSFRFLLRELGNELLSSLDKRVMEKFIIKTFARTQRGASLFYKTLKAAWTKAEDWEYVKENPFKKFKLPKIAQSFPVFLSHNEMMLIVSNEKRDDLKRIYLLAYYTGMRRAEIINLTWDSVDLERRLIKVSNSNGFVTKSKKERIVPICIPLLNILHALLGLKSEKAIYVFETARGVKYHDETMAKNFKKAVRASNLNSKTHFHTIRHSFASELIQNGVSINVVKELLGHADIATTMIYSHLKTENLVEALTAFDRIAKGVIQIRES